MFGKKKPKTPNFQKILKAKLYSNISNNLKKVLPSKSTKDIKLKLYRESIITNTIPKVTTYKKEKEKNLSSSTKPKILELNESMLNLFNEAGNITTKIKEHLESNKEINTLFFKRFKNYQKYEKLNAKKLMKKTNNSASINPNNFSVFDELVQKYKKRDGVLFTKEIFENKDILKETPILCSHEDRIRNFYVFNYDEYKKKSNLSLANVYKGIESTYKKKKKNNINYHNLTMTKFCNKLLSLSRKKIFELKFKISPDDKKFDYHYDYIGNKDIRTIKEIPKLKNDINKLNSLIKSIKKLDLKKENIEDYKTPMNTGKNLFKKIYLNNNESMESLNYIPTTKRSVENKEKFNKKSLILINNKILPLNKKIYYKKNTFNHQRNNNKNLLDYPSFSNTQKDNFFNIKQYKEEKSNIEQKTKTTFYTMNMKDKSFLSSRKNKSFTGKNIKIKNTENAYEALKKSNLDNKKEVMKNIEEHFTSKGYNVDRIKRGVKKIELYNFYDNMKNITNKFKCKQEMNTLHLMIPRRVSDKMSNNLNQIVDLDNEIGTTENQYYYCIVKGKY